MKSEEERAEEENAGTGRCEAKVVKTEAEAVKTEAEAIETEEPEVSIPVSAARILHELECLGWHTLAQDGRLRGDDPAALISVIPELKTMCGFQQNNPHHVYDVWQHTMAALASAGDDIIVDLAVLFHDTGKPECYTEDSSGIGHFYGHETVSAEIGSAVMERLGVEEIIRSKAVQLIRYHDADIQTKRKSVRKWLNRLGEEQFRRLLEVRRCDAKAQNPRYITEKLRKTDRIEELLDEAAAQLSRFGVKDLAVNGADLIRMGSEPGRNIGETLEKLKDSVIKGDVSNERDELLAWVKGKG